MSVESSVAVSASRPDEPGASSPLVAFLRCLISDFGWIQVQLFEGIRASLRDHLSSHQLCRLAAREQRPSDEPEAML